MIVEHLCVNKCSVNERLLSCLWKWSEGRKGSTCSVLAGEMVQVRQISIRGVRSVMLWHCMNI